MARGLYDRLIKLGVYAGATYLIGNLIWSMGQERNVRKAEAIRKHKLMRGQEFTEADLEEFRKAKEYESQHYGRKLLERMQTQYLIDEQIKFQIEEKKALRKKLLEDHNEEEVKKIEDDIEKLNDIFLKLNPKKKYVQKFDSNISKKDDLL